MNNINISEYVANTITIIFAIAGFITTIGATVKVLREWFNSTKTIKNAMTIQDHTQRIENHENRIKSLENRTDLQDEFIKVMCNSMLALLSHNINGDSKDKLEKAKEELDEFLINKK